MIQCICIYKDYLLETLHMLGICLTSLSLKRTYYYRGGSMKIRIKLYEIRTSKNLSIRQLAELSGVSKSEIDNIENGLKYPRVDTLVYLADALQVNWNDLVDIN